MQELIDVRSAINSILYSEDGVRLMKVESIGIPLRFSYIPVSYINHVLNTSNKIEDRMFELVSTGEKASIDYGASVLLFKLKKIKNAGNIVLNTIRRAASANKTKKSKIGGRKTTRHISKQNKRGGTRHISKQNKRGGRKTKRRLQS